MTEPSLQAEDAEKPTRNPLKKLYHWVLSWSESRYGAWALFAVAFAESSFFPIPPDALLIPLCLGRKKKALKLALICTIGSVLGALLGYFIGWALYEPVAEPTIRWFGLTAEFEHVQNLYHQYAGLAVSAAALTPLPFKLFTIGAGLCGINLFVFILASVIFRGLRFFAEALFLRKFGAGIRNFIERYFWLATIIFFALLVGGFLIVKHIAGVPKENPPATAPENVEGENGR
jgi:membrane protein YqaA with SNARE-associated domain